MTRASFRRRIDSLLQCHATLGAPKARLLAHLEPRTFFNANPAFVDLIDNPYFPLLPGAAFVYRGEGDGVSIRVRGNVLGETKEVMGVTCTIFREREFEDGEMVEDSRNFFAQDKAGTVWYF